MVCNSEKQSNKLNSLLDWEYGTYKPIDLWICDDCGLVYQNPLPLAQDIPRLYPEDYRNYMPLGQGPFTALKKLRFTSQAKQLLRHFSKSSKVLEIGYGNGQLLLSLKSLGVKELYGQDFSDASAESLNKAGIQVQVANAEEALAFESNVDVVILNNVIEHFINPRKVLINTFDKLNPGGKLILLTPNAKALEAEIFGKFWAGYHIPRHTYIFNKNNLSILLKQIGFRNMDFYKESDPAQWAFSCQNFLQSHRSNSRLKNGLAWYSIVLAMAFIPISLIQKIFFESESILLIAEK